MFGDRQRRQPQDLRYLPFRGHGQAHRKTGRLHGLEPRQPEGHHPDGRGRRRGRQRTAGEPVPRPLHGTHLSPHAGRGIDPETDVHGRKSPPGRLHPWVTDRSHGPDYYRRRDRPGQRRDARRVRAGPIHPGRNALYLRRRCLPHRHGDGPPEVRGSRRTSGDFGSDGHGALLPASDVQLRRLFRLQHL